jgi:PAS domain S-box-containing protein
MSRRIGLTLGEMKPNTALGLSLLATALLLLDNSRRPWRVISRGCALLAALIGVLTLIEYLTGFSLGIDRFMVPASFSAGTFHPLRTSVLSAFNLISLSCAILLLNVRLKRFLPSALLTWITGSLSFLTLTGYAYDAASLYQLRIFFHVSFPASLSFLFLCTAIMFVRPERGGAAILLSQDLGGEAARRLLPAAIFVPFAVSLLIFKLHQAGTYELPLMVFLFLVAPVAVFVPLVFLSAALLSKMERDREQSEDELRVSTQRFSSVVASAMDAIITLDESLSIIVFNEAAEKMFGVPSWEAIGKPLDRFLPIEVRASHEQRIRSFGEEGITTRSITAPGVLSAVRANGDEFPIEATVSQVRVAGQKLYTVILRDITERKHAEETLRQSEARFRSIYEQAAVGIEQVDLEGQMLMVNAALCRMLGYEERELLHKKTEDITHPDDHVFERELRLAMQREHRGSYAIEKRYLHRDGSIVWVSVSSSMVNDSAGLPLYRISVVQNVTERKIAEEQLKQAQKMEAIGRLAGGVAHDFNTLLNVMLGYSEMLLAELPPDDPRRDKVLQIKNSGSAGALLTRQLLAFSRKQGVAQEVLDLRDVASKMTPILKQVLKEHIDLMVKCSDDSCAVKVDPGQLQQLVLNLVANAGDAMPNGGRINIEVKAVELDQTYVRLHPTLTVGRYALLAISDTGSGMDAEP